MQVTKEDVLHIAELAHAPIPESEVERFVQVFQDTLDEISQIQDLELPSDEENTFSHSSGLVNVWRKDEIQPSLSQAKALSNTKFQHKGFFVVPGIFAE